MARQRQTDSEQAELTEEPQTDMDTLKNDLARIRKDLAAITEGMVERGIESAGAMKDSIQEALEERLDGAVRSVNRSIRTRPFTTLAIAFGAGFLVSTLMRHR